MLKSILLPSTRALSDVLLAGGFVGGISCLTLHSVGCGDPSVPISVEYANCNPLAIAFVTTMVALSAVTSVLYWRVANRIESILMGCATLWLLAIALTEPTSITHGIALGLTFISISLTPTVNAFRGDIGLGTIARVSMTLASMIILAMTATFPGSPVGLGIAERIWFVVIYVNNAWSLDIVRLER